MDDVMTRIKEEINHMCNTQNKSELHFDDIYQHNKAQFRALGVEDRHQNKRLFEKILEDTGSFHPLGTNHGSIARLKSKYDFRDHIAFEKFMKERPDWQLIPSDRDLHNSYPNCQRDVEADIKNHKIRATIMNGSRYLSSMELDNRHGLVNHASKNSPEGTVVNKNPQEFNKEGYLKFCVALFGGRGQQKDVITEQKQKNAEQSKYNDWVDGFGELKQQYLQEIRAKNSIT